jgi:hypothetical protein
MYCHGLGGIFKAGKLPALHKNAKVFRDLQEVATVSVFLAVGFLSLN